MLLTPTTEREVVDTIKTLSNKKSTSIDHPQLVNVLTHIINYSFSSTDYFPNQLKIAKVKPLYKKHYTADVENFSFF
jgi:hypothetical protein